MNGPLLTVKLLAVIYSKALCGLGVFVLHNEQNASGFHLHTELHSGRFTDPADYLCSLKMELPEAKKIYRSETKSVVESRIELGASKLFPKACFNHYRAPR